MSDAIYEVPKQQYTTVIREMIRHENDVTNHRIMWLLVGQGFIANAYVSVKDGATATHLLLGFAGTLVALSAFLMLYQSYQARGYLRFLGQEAKKGALKEELLPMVGWPQNRIKGWWRDSWVYPWFRQTRDLLEPWLLLPFLFTTMWMSSVLRTGSSMNLAVAFTLGAILSTVILSLLCILMAWSSKDDQSPQE